MSISSDFLFL